MNEFHEDYPKPGEKIGMIIYCSRGKFRITEEEEKQIFDDPDKTKDIIQKLLDIRKKKKKE